MMFVFVCDSLLPGITAIVDVKWHWVRYNGCVCRLRLHLKKNRSGSDFKPHLKMKEKNLRKKNLIWFTWDQGEKKIWSDLGQMSLLCERSPRHVDASSWSRNRHTACRIQSCSENTRVWNLKILSLTKFQSGGRTAEQTDCLSPRGLTGRLAPSVLACPTTYPLVSLREDTQIDWILVYKHTTGHVQKKNAVYNHHQWCYFLPG